MFNLLSLGTLCEKRHNAVVVMVIFSLACIIIVVIALMAAFSLASAHENTTPTGAITHDVAH